MRLVSSSSEDRRKPRQELGLRGQPFIEGGIGAEEPPGDRLRGDREEIQRKALRGSLFVQVHGGKTRSIQFFRVVGERETHLLLVAFVLSFRGPLPEEDRGFEIGRAS